jgi:hypothetical protein
MCPEGQILSLYHDGELPSPWKEKLERHLAACPSCAARLEGFRRLSARLAPSPASPPEEALEAAMGRVWNRIAPPPLSAKGGEGRRRERAYPRGLWGRRVSLPLPAAAAALAVLAFALAAALGRPPSRGLPGPEALSPGGIGLEAQGIAYPGDLDGLLRYLGDTDNGEMVIIRLPESKRFTSSGEPAILRAADYSGGPRGSGPPASPGGPPSR